MDPEVQATTGKFTVVLEIAYMIANKLSPYFGEQSVCPRQGKEWAKRPTMPDIRIFLPDKSKGN
jgi:hypothetical protein